MDRAMNGMMIKGAVDRLDSDGAIGWLYGADFAGPPIIRAFLRHDLIGETLADGYRPDLEQVGFGDGRCGFEIRFNRPIDPSYLPFVTIKPQDVDLHLPVAANNNSYMDLVNLLVGGYPGAGRSRSVLGGLWTDRLDAPQLLAGRLAVGSCAGDLQPALQEIIRSGHVLLHHALAPNGVGPKELDCLRVAAAGRGLDEGTGRLKGALSVVGGLLFRDLPVRLMRAIFDDQPVMYDVASLHGEQPFAQASAVERLPSPAECLAIYVGNPDGPVRIDVVRDSHELPEFDPIGRSRWIEPGREHLNRFALEAGLSIETIELDPLDIAVVSPGLVHRVVASREAPCFRALVSPRRVTPTRFLEGDGSWIEVGHVSGARIRL